MIVRFVNIRGENQWEQRECRLGCLVGYESVWSLTWKHRESPRTGTFLSGHSPALALGPDRLVSWSPRGRGEDRKVEAGTAS